MEERETKGPDPNIEQLIYCTEWPWHFYHAMEQYYCANHPIIFLNTRSEYNDADTHIVVCLTYKARKKTESRQWIQIISSGPGETDVVYL